MIGSGRSNVYLLRTVIIDLRCWIALGLALAALGCNKSASPHGSAGTAAAGKGVHGSAGMVAQGSAGASGHGAAGAGPAPGTFGSIYKNIIVAVGCNGAALCHAGTVGAGALSMNNKDQAYDALVGVMAMGKNLMMNKGMDCKDSGLTRVVPGKPDESLLMLKLQAKQPCGDPMPPATPLTPEKVQEFLDWIANGAIND